MGHRVLCGLILNERDGGGTLYQASRLKLLRAEELKVSKLESPSTLFLKLQASRSDFPAKVPTTRSNLCVPRPRRVHSCHCQESDVMTSTETVPTFNANPYTQRSGNVLKASTVPELRATVFVPHLYHLLS